MRYDSLKPFPFDLVGEFLGFEFDRHHHPRAMKVLWLDRAIMIRVVKALRDDRYDGWIPGMQVEVWGTQHWSKKKAKLKLDAHRIAVRSQNVGLSIVPLAKDFSTNTGSAIGVVESPTDNLAELNEKSNLTTNSSRAKNDMDIESKPTKKISEKPAAIKICGKPDCMKRGGKAMCKTLEIALKSGEWNPQIEVQFTGCMGKCSQGPNLVVMPDKKRYSKVTAEDIPQVLCQHFQMAT